VPNRHRTFRRSSVSSAGCSTTSPGLSPVAVNPLEISHVCHRDHNCWTAPGVLPFIACHRVGHRLEADFHFADGSKFMIGPDDDSHAADLRVAHHWMTNRSCKPQQAMERFFCGGDPADSYFFMGFGE
jgi:hypothetical protein